MPEGRRENVYPFIEASHVRACVCALGVRVRCIRVRARGETTRENAQDQKTQKFRLQQRKNSSCRRCSVGANSAAMLQPLPNHPEAALPAKSAPNRWAKGVSGNPSGRAKHILPDGRTVREAARDATPQALALLLQVIEDPKAAMPLRIAAAQAVLRTGHADAAPNDAGDAPTTIVVERLVGCSDTPVRGVLASPVAGHVWVAEDRMKVVS
jgi:Family of unknown function (DUF5681)